MDKKELIKNKIIIRSEGQEDYKKTEYMTLKAFWNLHAPGADEHLLVHKLREDSDYINEISRIAVLDGEVLGAIYYSKATLFYGDYKKEVLTFGPLCVDPAVQDYGVGGRLLTETMQLAKEAGYEAIVIFGEPYYYPKHGFVTCDKLGVTTMDGKNFDAFMGIELKKDALTGLSKKMGCKGRFLEGAVFENLPMDEADRLAKEFPPILKLKLPCQWKYANPTEEKNGYELVNAVQYKPDFLNMFKDYRGELAKCEALSERAEENAENTAQACFIAPNRKPFVIMNKKSPIGFVVFSFYCDTELKNGFYKIDEIYVKQFFRRKGIAGDVVQTAWNQNSLACEINILSENSYAVHFFKKLADSSDVRYVTEEADGYIKVILPPRQEG